MITLVNVPPLLISKEHKQVLTGTRYLNVLEIMNKCEFCGQNMTEEEYNFCDICPECRDENYE